MSDDNPKQNIRLFQIREDDLAELEQLLPQISDALFFWGKPNNAIRIKFRRVQAILSNVRWNYGPPTDIESLPAGDGPEA